MIRTRVTLAAFLIAAVSAAAIAQAPANPPVRIRGRGYFHDGGMSGSEDFIGARLAPGDTLGADPIIARFERAAGGLPEGLRLALEACLREYALQNAEGAARRSRFRRADWQRTGGGRKLQEDRGSRP